MKKILFTLLVSLLTLNLQAQTTFLDFVSEIPCLESRKVDYSKVKNIKNNEIKDLSDIDIDFILDNEIYLLNRSDNNFLLFSIHNLDLKKKGKYSFFARNYLLIDKSEKRCYQFTSGTIITQAIKKVKKKIIYTNCMPSSVLDKDNTIWEIGIISNQFPYEVKYSFYYDAIYSFNEIKNDKQGDFTNIIINKNNQSFNIDSDIIDASLLYNINRVSKDDFMRIISTLINQIEEGKYKKHERALD